MALEKAMITNTTTGDKVTVLFNPEEYRLNRDINYAQIAVPGLSGAAAAVRARQHADARDGAVPRHLRGAREGSRSREPGGRRRAARCGT